MPRIYTIGHSNRSLEAFLALLKRHSIALLVDVRKMPRSGYNPHFSQEALAASLHESGCDYRHMPGLGGMRKSSSASSINTGWRNLSFRAYADYMQTPEFAAQLDLLTQLAAARPTAVMCAEAVPWRCHRSLIADALLARGGEVVDILAENRAQPHELTSFARVADGNVTYPSAEPQLQLDV